MVATRAGTSRLLRDLNRSIVFNLIFTEGPISRADVARRSNLTAAAITQIVGDFVAAGLVRERPAEIAGVGRRPTLLELNAGAGYVVGVYTKFDDAMLVIAVCDLKCDVIHSTMLPHDFTSKGEPHQVVPVIADGIRSCLTKAKVPYRRVLGVGLGLPGIMDAARGVCIDSPMFGWRDVEVAPALEFRLRLPVRLDNDVNALTLAKQHFGDGRGVANFILIGVGYGVGLGIVANGAIYRGAWGGAGEFGHSRIDISADAPRCHCGKRGCLEAIVANYALVRQAQAVDPVRFRGATLATLVAAAHAGDERIQAILAHAGTVLGIAAANLINVLDPSLVLFSGEGLEASEYVLGPMRQAIQEEAFGGLRATLDVNPEPTEDIMWARGAASVMLDELFRPPLHETDQPWSIDELLSVERMHANGGKTRAGRDRSGREAVASE